MNTAISHGITQNEKRIFTGEGNIQKITLYRFIRPDGGVTVSPVKPNGEYIKMFRLVADEGYVLTNGVTTTLFCDTDNAEAWTEVEYREE